MNQVLACKIGGIHIKKKNSQYKANNINSNSNQLPHPIFCLQDPSEHNDTATQEINQESSRITLVKDVHSDKPLHICKEIKLKDENI
jgi:hypothetical protein